MPVSAPRSRGPGLKQRESSKRIRLDFPRIPLPRPWKGCKVVLAIRSEIFFGHAGASALQNLLSFASLLP